MPIGKLATAAMPASSSASTDSSETSLRRAAPSDDRIAISPIRAAPRASIRFAMFTQPINRIVRRRTEQHRERLVSPAEAPALAARAGLEHMAFAR